MLMLKMMLIAPQLRSSLFSSKGQHAPVQGNRDITSSVAVTVTAAAAA
jgi:hypothetical protein